MPVSKPKKYRVNYFRTSIGPEQARLSEFLGALSEPLKKTKSKNFAKLELQGRAFQVRDFVPLAKFENLHCGVFCLLRDDAPNKVDADDREQSLELDPDDRLIEKSHFLYDVENDILVWQLNTTCCWPSKIGDYFGKLLNAETHILSILELDSMKRVLDGDVKSFSMKVANPATFSKSAPEWSKRAMGLLNGVNGTEIKLELKSRRGTLTKDVVADVLQYARSDSHTKSLKAELIDDKEPIDLLANRVSGSIVVDLIGRYPSKEKVIAALKSDYDKNREEILKLIRVD